MVVPQEFVLQDAKGRYVYVVDEDNVVQTKYFKDNGQYENYWIVKSGLDKNDKFIATNLTKLMPKQKVRIAEVQNNAALTGDAEELDSFQQKNGDKK